VAVTVPATVTFLYCAQEKLPATIVVKPDVAQLFPPKRQKANSMSAALLVVIEASIFDPLL
jgi:hypothetical protein